MIKQLSIKHFKSIKSLQINCKRVNIFIGDSNTGKSNILEALSFFSTGASDQDVFSKLFRFKSVGDLFSDFDFSRPIEVESDQLKYRLLYGKDDRGATISQFQASYTKPSPPNPHDAYRIKLEHDGKFTQEGGLGFETAVRTYIFQRAKNFKLRYLPFLDPPFGENLPLLLVSNSELRKTVSNLFREKGFRLQLKPVENDINMAKEVEDELYSYPYYTVSETLQRIIFMMMAIDSNENASLVFDEPEANTFPFYTKYIAERIALDERNQYFITTHNPYLLMSLIEKTKLIDLNIFVCSMENYETKADLLTNEKIQEALDLGSDVFFNLDEISKK